MQKRQITPDPIHGSIELPNWLLHIATEKPVRRMMFIRQLGLKAYIDFPGAIHTRYSHVLGVMHLAGRLTKLLADRELRRGNSEKATTLEKNRDNLMVAGFFHDVGHGPFSHTVDFPLQLMSSKSHEDVAVDILVKYFKDLENYGSISIDSVTKIIRKKHEFPFIHDVINGQIDVDKLDYLLRDSYHIGLRYSFDLEHFVNSYLVLGDDKCLSGCEIGLEDSSEAITTAELFLMIWKSMYDLIYYHESSRIAEKMLEKAIIDACKDHADFKEKFQKLELFAELHDESLLASLESYSSFPKEIVEGIRTRTLFVKKFTIELNQSNFEMTEEFLDALNKDDSLLSDNMSKRLCERYGCTDYYLICDIIKSRTPKPVNLDRVDANGQPIELHQVSDIIKTMKEKMMINVYAHPSLDTITDAFINQKIAELTSTWA